jgi:hypothetical protein
MGAARGAASRRGAAPGAAARRYEGRVATQCRASTLRPIRFRRCPHRQGTPTCEARTPASRGRSGECLRFTLPQQARTASLRTSLWRQALGHSTKRSRTWSTVGKPNPRPAHTTDGNGRRRPRACRDRRRAARSRERPSGRRALVCPGQHHNEEQGGRRRCEAHAPCHRAMTRRRRLRSPGDRRAGARRAAGPPPRRPAGRGASAAARPPGGAGPPAPRPPRAPPRR